MPNRSKPTNTAPANAQCTPLRFVRRDAITTLHNVPPDRTLLEVLREDLHCTGTKEGCNEGDCGACTVVLGEEVDGELKTRAVNSCIRLAHSIDGMALWTVEDIGPSTERGGVTTLHPAQEAVAQCHGSQCGFCTPGFVMSLFDLYHQRQALGNQPISREDAVHALSGNLCRCTGYRPLLDAAMAMQKLPTAPMPGKQTLSLLKQLAQDTRGLQPDSAYMSPRNLRDFLQMRARHPLAQLVAGCTDVGLWVTKLHRQFERVLDVTRVAELRQVQHYTHHIAIGAAASLTDAYATLVADRPQLASFAARFAGLPVRNSGTLGGNVANGSPIGDSMPLLIALNANIVLMAWRDGRQVHREMPLEALYTGYRQSVMAKDEVLAWIKVPKATAGEFNRVYKVSKRQEDDISAVCLALNITLQNGRVHSSSIGVGGVAATPVRAVRTEAALRDQHWNEATLQNAAIALAAEFSPISDMRASSAYRVQVLGNLLKRFWLESQQRAASLDDLPSSLAASTAEVAV